MAKVGRPRKTLKDLPTNWKQTALDLYREGASDVEIRVELGITSPVWYKLIENYEEFASTIKEGKELSEAWWVKMGRKNLMMTPKGEQMNYTGWYMNMKNRFGWKDKQEVSGDRDNPIQLGVIVLPKEEPNCIEAPEVKVLKGKS